MKKAKDEIRDLLEQLPEDVSLEEIQYRIYIRQKIEKGMQAALEGRLLSQAEVEARIERLRRTNASARVTSVSDYDRQ
jgi:hypothetical protein